MTSKNLFFNLMKEDLKRRLWSIALACLVFFLSLPVFAAMTVSNASPGDSWIANEIMRFFLPQPWLCVITIVGSLICGMNGFFYLHSRQKVDLFHSLPVKRETIFAVHYLNGILIYLVPYLVNTLLALAIAAPTWHFAGHRTELFTAAFIGLGVNLVFYILLYSVVVLSMTVTGNPVIGAGVYAILCGYGPALIGMKEMLFGMFFDTYSSFSDQMTKWLSRTSPLGWYMSNVEKIGKRLDQNELNMVQAIDMRVILITIIVSALFIAASLLIYKARPSESAGKSFAFMRIRPVIKVMLTVPAVILIGVFFRSIAGGHFRPAWFVFGLAFGVVVISAIIEIIFRFDFKAAFRGKASLAVSTVLVAAIVCVFQFDLFGYDRYLPKENKIEYMAMLDWDLSNGSELNYSSNLLEEMQVTDFHALYEMAKLGTESLDMRDSNGMKTENYRIAYRLKNGRTAYRDYVVPQEKAAAFHEAIFDNPEYRRGIYPILRENPAEVLSVQAVMLGSDRLLSGLSEADRVRLMQVYQKELEGLTYQDAKTNRIVCTLQFDTKSLREKEAGRYRWVEDDSFAFLAHEYPVYESFTETLTILKSAGCKTSFRELLDSVDYIRLEFEEKPAETETQTDEEDQPATHEDYYEYEGITAESEYGKYAYGPKAEIHERREIEAILNAMSFYGMYNRQAIPDSETPYIVVYFKEEENGRQQTFGGYFPKGTIPAFVKELQK